MTNRQSQLTYVISNIGSDQHISRIVFLMF